MTPPREPSGAEDFPNESPFPAVPERNFAAQRTTLLGLLVAAIVLPFLYVAAMSWNDLMSREADAVAVTVRNARVAEEHALKVFDMNATLNERVIDLIDGMNDAAIQLDEAAIHGKLQAIGGSYPQVASVSIFSAAGQLLASSRVYPVPNISIATRDDFTGIRDARELEHLSRVMNGRVAGENVFNTAVPRLTSEGRFAGIVSISLRTAYFSQFYSELLGPESSVSLGLVRDDGAVLVWYPRRPADRPDLSANSALRTAVANGGRSGLVRLRSGIDHTVKVFAYRRVGSYPAYVASGYPISTVWAAWYRHLSVLVISLFAPCIVLWGVIGLSLGRLATEQDAWERWQAEASMRRSIESAYRQARKMEALGNLVGSVAHDFNNLLMILSTNVQIARRRSVAGLDNELSAMERALKSGQSLTRQLLGVARKQPLSNETITIGKWLPACRELLKASLGAKVALHLETSIDIWPIRVDPAELELALINVAVNARDAMPGGGTFSVRTSNVRFRHEDGFPITGEFVQLTLEDTGTGMNEDVLGRAFEPLFTTKPQGMGTGLGLPQVFAFCERAGGIATIDSAIGAGTSVRLYLPRANGIAPAETVPRDERAVASVPNAQPGLRVLLVEDNEEVAAGTEALLTMMNHKVTSVFNADAAIALLDQTRGEPASGGVPPFDVVLSDIHMPGKMNGIDLAEVLTTCEPRMPVILVTGYAEELERARHVNVRVLSKPFDIGLLESLLLAIREGSAARADDREHGEARH
jgi:signal transduction histidine kinase/CheY-like chemotaxis protein